MFSGPKMIHGTADSVTSTPRNPGMIAEISLSPCHFLFLSLSTRRAAGPPAGRCGSEHRRPYERDRGLRMAHRCIVWSLCQKLQKTKNNCHDCQAE